MMLIRRIASALLTGLLFFLCTVVLMVVFGCVLAHLKGLQYIFHDAMVQGIRSGLYSGGVIILLKLVGTSRREPL